jgi:CelD/BcsL family acetyltransferase involved in cellulose biosynthesis
MALTADLLDDPAALAPHRAAWDTLALAARRPYCAPAWMLAWWQEVAPPGALLRVVVVREGAEVVGVGPFWAGAEDGRYGLLAERNASPLEPLAREELLPRVAAACSEAIAAADPAPREIVFRNTPAGSPWPRLLLDSWPAAAPGALRRARPTPVPKVTLGQAGFDEWLGGRSRNFRQQVRRTRRRLAELGASFRIAGLDDLDTDLSSLARLHHARWSRRGGSRALDERVERLLGRAGRELIPAGRFRLWSLDVDGATISSHLFVAGDGGQAYWLGGFDDAWAAERPAIQVLVRAVEDGIARGERWLELGPGGQPYKYRLADSEDVVESVTFRPAGA